MPKRKLNSEEPGKSIKCASADRILQRFLESGQGEIREVKSRASLNGKRHNFYKDGIKSFEISGGIEVTLEAALAARPEILLPAKKGRPRNPPKTDGAKRPTRARRRSSKPAVHSELPIEESLVEIVQVPDDSKHFETGVPTDEEDDSEFTLLIEGDDEAMLREASQLLMLEVPLGGEVEQQPFMAEPDGSAEAKSIVEGERSGTGGIVRYDIFLDPSPDFVDDMLRSAYLGRLRAIVTLPNGNKTWRPVNVHWGAIRLINPPKNE